MTLTIFALYDSFPTDDTMIWILSGSVVGILLACVVIIVCVIVCKKRRRKKSWDLGWNDTDCILESKSAPISRYIYD